MNPYGRASAVLLVLAALGGCAWPTHDQSRLAEVKTEAALLVAQHPVNPQGWADIPREQWPRAIASLGPRDVTVFRWGVDVTTKPYFDGGWGYDIPTDKRDLPMPAQCYSDLGQGVFWHGPC